MRRLKASAGDRSTGMPELNGKPPRPLRTAREGERREYTEYAKTARSARTARRRINASRVEVKK